MAKFFGTVQGERGKATRLGRSSLRVSAQSYAGSVVIHMYDDNCTIMVGSGSTGSGEYTLYNGPIKGLFNDQSSFNFGR